MTKEQRDKILKLMAEERNNYARDCDRRIAREEGKIVGADYMIQRFLDVLSPEVEPQESETWNGIHGQITAPKGTYEKIWKEAGK